MLIFAGIVVILIGVYSLSAALGNWEWFFDTLTAQEIEMWLGGRNGARIFYAVSGILLILAGIFLILMKFWFV